MPVETPLAFIARQPVFDSEKNVFGYELLFRSGRDNFFSNTDGDNASARTISNTMHVMGLGELTANKRAFINITRKLLLEGLYSVLPRERAIIELLETVEPDREVIAACKRLKAAGYTLALDDFVLRPGYEKLVEIADILKVDFMASDANQRREYARRFGGRSLALLAEKVEKPEEYREAIGLGYTYFQGYFFCKPELITAKDIPAFKRNYLRFLAEVYRPEIDYAALEAAIKREVSLSVKLLKYLNSSAFGVRHKIGSIQQALSLLGETAVKKWAAVVALAGLGEDKPLELAVLCVARGRFCEAVGAAMGLAGRDLDLFVMGLLSGLDALVDRPLTEVLSQTPLPEDVTAALLGTDTQTRLGRVYTLVLACERGHWGRVGAIAVQLGLQDEEVAGMYQESLRWTDELMNKTR
jgi:EAL and modified HD-GYP domain-containing signal transduction protein